jgi:hypothetical protein
MRKKEQSFTLGESSRLITRRAVIAAAGLSSRFALCRFSGRFEFCGATALFRG